jgi:hypothetical protein
MSILRRPHAVLFNRRFPPGHKELLNAPLASRRGLGYWLLRYPGYSFHASARGEI